MQNPGANGSGGGGRVKAEDVISKLKDDGDFDRLRVKIIRKLKENEELRSNIISLVKQSAALNCPDAGTMKPRLLSDAIHQEIGAKLMDQVSDGVWNIIRSPDGMKAEITETVRSIYEKLANPHVEENGESSTRMDAVPIPSEHGKKKDATGAGEHDGMLSDGEPNEPPGFGPTDLKRNKKNHMSQANMNRVSSQNGEVVSKSQGKILHSVGSHEPEDLDLSPPPGFSSILKRKKLVHGSDEDPDVPPGFG